MTDVLMQVITWHTIPYTTGLLFFFLQTQLYVYAWAFYWHNSVSHKHYTIVPWLQHVIRFWMWINSTIWAQGHLTKWTAEHRIHHMELEEGDPFCVKKFSLWELFTYEQRPGAARYVSPEEVAVWGDPSAEPNDPATMFYKKHQFKGVWISTLAWTVLLGPLGFVLGLLMPYWNKYYSTFHGDWFWHKYGYQHPEDPGTARNFMPWLIGEGLHSNHHAVPSAVNKAYRWFEIDFNYYFLVVLSWFKIIKFSTNPPTNMFNFRNFKHKKETQ